MAQDSFPDARYSEHLLNNKATHSLVGVAAVAADSDDSDHSSSHSISPLPEQLADVKAATHASSSATACSALTITLCITYVILSTQMPFYNKIALEIYAYPITSCFLQVLGVVLTLLVVLCIMHCFQHKSSPFQYLLRLFSGKYFVFKCKHLCLPSFFFSCNIILTNIGIELTSVDLHILLRATEIIWFVLLTPVFTNDKPTKQAILAAFIVTIGAGALAFSSMDTDSISLAALVINILSAFFTPLQIIFLRRATNQIIAFKQASMHDQSGQLSRDETMQITCLKMLLSLLFILPAALIVETHTAFVDLTRNFGLGCNVWVLCIGVILTLLMQWNVVALTSKVEPVLIGTLQQSKGIWVYLASLIIGAATLKLCECEVELKCGKDYPSCPCFKNPQDAFHGDFAIPHVVGVVAILLGIVYYSALKYKGSTTRRPQMQQQ